MKYQITIIGLGQIGASVGLALGEHPDLLYRVGHDLEIKVARQAEKMGALDKVSVNLPSAVQDADIVLLSLPLDQIRDTMAVIADDLKEGAVVMDTAPVKEVVANWAAELLPEKRHYIGLTPVINPAYLHTHESGVEAAHADLFKDGLIAIVAPPRTASEAVKLAADLTRLLGSTPLFADPIEIDSLMSATHILPQLLAAALLNITVDQPGWYEGRKLAGRAYAEMTGPVVQMGEAAGLCSAAIHARESMLRVTDSLIAALQAIRSDIDKESYQTLVERVERARSDRGRWWSQRLAANWTAEEMPSTRAPESSSAFGRLFGLGRRPKEDKNQ